MLKKHSELLVAALRALDLLTVAAAWMGSYLLAFRFGVIPTLTGAIGPGMEDPLRFYARALLVILPVAAVVLPRLSSASVFFLTSSPSPLISAFPPALSAIGP